VTHLRDLAYVALGSNLGDRAASLARARAAIGALAGCRIVGQSSVEETAPLGPVDQPAFLNQMIVIETTLAPRALLDALLEIERREGRTRDVRWGPRTLDLDIVRFARQTANEPDLRVPHPEIANRDFWQRELAELAAASAAAEGAQVVDASQAVDPGRTEGTEGAAS
jgi:2-amino-4-hydroxy-6-hydroxymethyldihydropteridine diphosphokinase